MKITKSQLKQIIKEELEKLYEEEKASICKRPEQQEAYDAGRKAGLASAAGDSIPEDKKDDVCWRQGWFAAL